MTAHSSELKHWADVELRLAFGSEYDELSIDDRDKLAVDLIDTCADLDSIREYRNNIGPGRLASYARTLKGERVNTITLTDDERSSLEVYFGSGNAADPKLRRSRLEVVAFDDGRTHLLVDFGLDSPMTEAFKLSRQPNGRLLLEDYDHDFWDKYEGRKQS